MQQPLSRSWGALLLLVATTAGCEPAYVPTIAPVNASFEVSCAATCGLEGREQGVVIDVSFVGHSRQFALCCDELSALRARLVTIQDHWCEGLEVPLKKIGDLQVGTTESEATGKRGATLDQGAGYVAFNCGDWLGKLQDDLAGIDCCRRASAEPSHAQPAALPQQPLPALVGPT